ncbi:uncharacterized protein LOC124895875 [Capsicum annuum]|uniref:uncharacterized protein LOC124895875 n=1 Tax=Capsicum annuum TaxID=4072 RepID=UPI001FB070E3|nr:uncharacterized protein LOC124895875 [Capsicum annuum]
MTWSSKKVFEETHDLEVGKDVLEYNAASSQDKAKAMIFLRHHLDEGLKVEYLTVKDPLELWTDLKGRYDHLKATIISQLKLCGETINDEDMMKKILTTFHASNIILQQQYREKDFQKYSELILCLLVAEQHNAILMKNHETHPTGAAPLPKVNWVQAHGQPERRQDRGYNNMCGRGNGRGRYNNRRGGGPSQKYDDNVEANLVLKDDDFNGLDDITHLEAEDFFGDQN